MYICIVTTILLQQKRLNNYTLFLLCNVFNDLQIQNTLMIINID
jgi:hypothetical protein